jgi:broad specificity phosphatase PhoE
MLILLRHGQTTANAQALLQGHMNLPLDPEGERQAQRSGEYLRAAFPDALVISSPLTRAHQTALAVSSNVVIDERFIELDYGQWDGIALTDVDAQSWADWRADPGFRPPGGETLVELDARVRPALDEIAERAQHGHVIVVSHVSPIKSGVTWALGVGPEVSWRCQLDRASICRIAISPRGPSLVALNDTSHL